MGGGEEIPSAAEVVEADVRIDQIDIGDRLRPVDPATAADLAVSIREAGLAHPITVRPWADKYRLVIGAHRLAAFGLLGRPTIPATIRQLSDLEARQLEIDENIIRSGLTALDRLTFLAERVEVWAARNPEKVVLDASQPVRRRGRPPRFFAKLSNIEGFAPSMMGFATETARDTGLSRRTVDRAIQTLSGLPTPLRARLQGSWIARNDAALRQLAGIGDPVEQAAVAELMLAGRTRSVAEARALAAGATIPPKGGSNTVQRDFEKAWKAASATQRAAMLDWLSGQRLPAGWTVEGGRD